MDDALLVDRLDRLEHLLPREAREVAVARRGPRGVAPAREDRREVRFSRLHDHVDAARRAVDVRREEPDDALLACAAPNQVRRLAWRTFAGLVASAPRPRRRIVLRGYRGVRRDPVRVPRGASPARRRSSVISFA